MSYETDEIAQYLTDGFWEWRGDGRRNFGVRTGDTLTANISALNEDGQQLALWAMDAWSTVSGIHFQIVTDNDAHIVFDDEEDGGFVEFSVSNGIIRSAKVNVSSTYIVFDGNSIDSNTFRIYLHEIGHALGLGHPGPYMDEAVYGEDNIFRSDSWQETVMSYFSQYNDWVWASHAVPVTPMPADIAAIHELYGVPENINPGDTVYGYQSNVGNYLDLAFSEFTTNEGAGLDDPLPPEIALPPPPSSQSLNAGESDAFVGRPVTFTIVDSSGEDTLDFRTDTANQSVNLRPDTISDVYGLTGNLIIERNTVIENYTAGSGNDVILGNDVDNRLNGGSGNDTLEGGAGADSLSGGDGSDISSYERSDVGVMVRLHNQKSKYGHAEGDVFAVLIDVEQERVPDIEHLIGSDHADVLAGDGRNNILRGGDGDDTLFGGPGGGDDFMSGGNGDDRIYGGKGNDRIVGGGGNDLLKGGPGDDVILIDGFAIDELYGGSGRDRFKFYPNVGSGGWIRDFTDGVDVIDLRAFENVESMDDLDISRGQELRVDISGPGYSVTISLPGFDVNDLDNSDFLF